MVAAPAPEDTGTIVRTGGDGHPRGAVAGLAVTVLAIGVAVMFAATGGTTTDVLVGVVQVQGLSAQRGAPSAAAVGAARATAFGLAFPDIEGRLGWRSVGRRDDVIAGRRASTLIYGRRGRRVGYSVVDGAPLPVSGRRIAVRGPTVVSIEASGRTAVASERGGHTVVVSGVGVPLVALMRVVRAS